MSDFSDLLDHAIARSNLSMLELQEASGIPISYLYKLRKGVREYVLRKNIPPTFCP